MWQSDKKIRNLLWKIADVGRLTSYYSDCYRAVTHATRGTDGRQEGCERGYYHLHR